MTADSCQYGLFRDERTFAANGEAISPRLSAPMRLGTSIMNVLVIDIGGTNVKILATGQRESVKFASGPAMTAKAMVAGVKKRTRDWKYDVISAGYPGPVLRGCPKAEPRNFAPGWV
jgi:hypothetical protein